MNYSTARVCHFSCFSFSFFATNLISILSQTLVCLACFMSPGLYYCTFIRQGYLSSLLLSPLTCLFGLFLFIFFRTLQNCNIFMGQDFLLSVNVFLHIYHFASSIFTLSGFPSLVYHCSSFLDLLLCQRLADGTTCLLYDSYVIQVRNNPCQWGRC